MCPMRFVLVFFSLVIAAYLAFKSFCLNGDSPSDGLSDTVHLAEDVAATEVEEKGLLKRGYAKLTSALSTLVDMASGRYLWRTVTSNQKKTC